MALRVPVVDVQDEAAAVRLRRVELRIGDRRRAEQRLAAPAPPQQIGVVDGVADFVAQDAHAPGRRAAFDLEHLLALEPRQPRMREVERDGDARHAVRREPLVRQPEVRPEARCRARPAPRRARRSASRSTLPSIGDVELGHPQIEQFVVGPFRPARRFAARARRRAARRGRYGRAGAGGGLDRVRLVGAASITPPEWPETTKMPTGRRREVPECAGKGRSSPMKGLRQTWAAVILLSAAAASAQTARPARQYTID